MNKKIIAIFLSIALLFTGCGSPSSAETTTKPSAVAETSIATASTESGDMSDIEALGNVDVEKELFDVIITIPATYEEGTTQEQLDEQAKENGYKATLNEDGSVTYVMTKSQHKKMMKDFKEYLNTSLAEMVQSEDYPDFINIKTNDDFTEFIVTTTSDELDFAESFSVLTFYMFGGMYHVFNGTTVDNIHVEFINSDTGKVISSADSKDMGAESTE